MYVMKWFFMMRLFAAIVLVFLSSCAGTLAKHEALAPLFTARQVDPDEHHVITAVAVIVHGLNFNPSLMDDWSTEFSRHGIVVMRVVLPGHDGVQNSMKGVSAELWRKEIDANMVSAQATASRYSVPLIFVGYSLGGLVGIDWLSRQPANARLFDKMVLFAPAIATPWYSELAQKLLARLDGETIIPTPSPRMFRASGGSSVHAYRALFELKSSVHASSFRNANIKTLLIVDRFDELTPYQEIKRLITEHRLGNWHLETFNNRYAHRNHGFRHLIATKDSVGTEQFETISRQVLKHCGVSF